MGANATGTPKAPNPFKPPTGKAMNASISPPERSRASRSKRKPNRQFLRRVGDKALKAAVWYTLITILFRCPSDANDVLPSSPRICKPYRQTEATIRPYVQPYYDQYVHPYVQPVQPYYHRFHEQIYQPACATYKHYGAPRVAQLQQVGARQWQSKVEPSIHFAQQQAGKQYEKTLAPYVEEAQGVVYPYYKSLVTSASDIWELELEPAYRKAAPYAQKAYQYTQAFARDIVVPQMQWAGSAAWRLWSRQIWPKLRILYGENVEPQLMRITERLGRYKDGKKLEAGVKSMESSSKAIQPTASAEAGASSLLATDSTSATVSPSSSASVPTSASASASASTAPSADPRIRFQEDLKSWEQVSAKAVDEGAEDLRERVQEITAHQGSSAASVGKALVTQLEQTTETALQSLRDRIQQIVQGLPEDVTNAQQDAANEELVRTVRAAGQSVKQRAQAVRDWRQSAQTETDALVEKALQSTLETIDSIRDLRLTEIGRKYASSGLPHKEWSKYNDIKKATQSWRKDVEKTAREHKGRAEVKAVGDDIEATAMAIAEDAATELGRLKKVGQWKIAAGDASDDFTTKNLPAPVRKVKDQVGEKVGEVSEAIVGSERGTVKSLTAVAAEKASALASQASAAVYESTGSVEGVSSKISEAASSLSEKVIGSSTGTVASVSSQIARAASSVVSQASSPSASEVASAASGAIYGTSSLADTVENAASSVSSAASSASAAAASLVDDSPRARDVAQAVDAAAQKVAQAPKKVWGGANAEVIVEVREPILDDEMVDIGEEDDSYSASVQKIIAAAGEQANQLTQAIQDALHPATTTQGTVESVSRLANEQYESALLAASSAMFGTQNAADKATGIAREQYQAAVTAASHAIYGTPATAAPLAAASSAYDSIVSEASKNYDAVRSRISQQISGTPVPTQQQALASAESAYSSVVGAAHHALNEASATASSAYAEAISQAASNYDGVKSYISAQISGTPVPVHQHVLANAESAYSSAVAAASYAIYGAPITAAPFAAASSAYNNALNEASTQYNAIKSRISVQVSGTPEPLQNQMLQSAGSAYSNAVSAANAKYFSAFPTQNYYARISSLASSRLAEGVTYAQQQYKSAKSAVGAEPAPLHQQYMTSVQAQYYRGLGLAHGRYNEFIEAASSAFVPTPTATGYRASVESALNQARSGYSDYVSGASSTYSLLLSKASSAASSQSTTVDKGTLEQLQKQVGDQVSLAQSRLSEASASASSLYHNEAPTTEKPITSQAAENWDALIAKASSQIYGAPPPWTDQVYSRASAYAASVTDAAAGYAASATGAAAAAGVAAVAQWDQVQALFSELIVGKEPDFTASAYSRLQSAYATGAPGIASQASSYVSDTYGSMAAAVSARFVPPTQVPSIVEQMQEQLNAAVEAASAQVYGTQKGTLEQATEAAASMYSDAASQVSGAIYGTPAPYIDAAQSSIFDIGASASSAISAAIYGTPAPTIEAASSAAASVYASYSSVAAEQASAASAAVSKAIYGEEQTYAESVQSQLSVAMASASSRLAELGVGAGSAFDEATKSVSSVLEKSTGRVRDEL